MNIDIRHRVNDEIDSITFAGFSGSDAAGLQKLGSSVEIQSEDAALTIGCVEDARNLIKALQKALELNWWNE